MPMAFRSRACRTRCSALPCRCRAGPRRCRSCGGNYPPKLLTFGSNVVKYKNPEQNAWMEKNCAAPGQQREGDGGSPSAGSMAAAPERPGTTGTSVRVKDDLRRRVSGNQGGPVNARMPSPLSMGRRHLFLKGDVLWTVCVVMARWSIWGRNPYSSGNTVF